MASTDEMIRQARELLYARQPDQARWIIRKLLTRDKGNPDVIALVGLVDRMRGRWREALVYLIPTAQQFPDNAALIEQLALAQYEAGDVEQALPNLERLQTLNPNVGPAIGILAVARMMRQDWQGAGELIRRLVKLEPANSSAWLMFGTERLNVGDVAEAQRAFEQAMRLDPADPSALSNLSLLATYRDIAPPASGPFSANMSAYPHPAPLAPMTTPRRPGRLRIGYLSPDFRTHSVSVFFEPVLRAHDRTRFEIFCYAAVAVTDDTTMRLYAAVEHWRDIEKVSNQQAAECIRADDLDLLIDLAGHTGHNRLPIFTYRPARKSASWLGYPNTTGLSTIDYRFGDTTTDTADAQRWHSEKLVRLPRTFFVYPGAGDAAPDPQPPPVLQTRKVSFGVPTNIAKVRPDMVRVWAKILAQLPGSTITFKASGASVPESQAWIREIFRQAGIDDSRIMFLGQGPFAEYLQLHAHWDIILDTFPFNGHTTTCHALWMGVPVVTLAGKTHASRMGASILHDIGLDDWIAVDERQYVEIAIAMANDPARLAELHAGLRKRLSTAYMCNPAAFTRDLETAFETLLTCQSSPG